MWDAATATPVFNIGYVTPPPPIRSSELQSLPPSIQPPLPPLSPSHNSLLPPAVTLLRLHTEPPRVFGRTRLKTVQFSNGPTTHISGTPEEPISSPPVPSDQGLHHSVGLPMMSKTALLSTVTPRGIVDARRRNKPPRFGGRGQQ